MKYGFVRAAAVSPRVYVNNPQKNASAIIEKIKELRARGVEIAVFPELSVTGYTAADLFFTEKLLTGAVAAVKKIAENTPKNMIVFVGAPLKCEGRLYNCAVALSDGKVLGAVPKTEIPDYCEFYEKRYFASAPGGVRKLDDIDAPMGDLLFEAKGVIIGAEICEDMWVDVPPAVEETRAGATVIVNLSASDEVIGKADYRKLLVRASSGKYRCAYIYCDAGAGESTTDLVFSAHNIIAENGSVVAESEPFGSGEAVYDIDVQLLSTERRKVGVKLSDKQFVKIPFSLDDKKDELVRKVDRLPFVPSADLQSRAETILTMQSRALRSRMDAIKSKYAVIGVSGGLDSALALLVCCRAVGADRVYAVTMPCFGTSEKTLGNAKSLCAALGVKLKTIDIKEVVEKHLADIEHTARDVTYENAQARVRTMTLFDLANAVGGIVVGTGDLSELALGWATYNGDHMSSFCVNGGVPKTLVKSLVGYEAGRLGGKVKDALVAILGTDISPELLPPEDGKIAQKTEEILGKYDLLDFVMYYYVRHGFDRKKIEYLLSVAYGDVDEDERKKAIDTFFKRFFAAQFKRSCLPDGVKIGSVSFSPRSDFRMPSDVSDEE